MSQFVSRFGRRGTLALCLLATQCTGRRVSIGSSMSHCERAVSVRSANTRDTSTLRRDVERSTCRVRARTVPVVCSGAVPEQCVRTACGAKRRTRLDPGVHAAVRDGCRLPRARRVALRRRRVPPVNGGSERQVGMQAASCASRTTGKTNSRIDRHSLDTGEGTSFDDFASAPANAQAPAPGARIGPFEVS